MDNQEKLFIAKQANRAAARAMARSQAKIDAAYAGIKGMGALGAAGAAGGANALYQDGDKGEAFGQGAGAILGLLAARAGARGFSRVHNFDAHTNRLTQKALARAGHGTRYQQNRARAQFIKNRYPQDKTRKWTYGLDGGRKRPFPERLWNSTSGDRSLAGKYKQHIPLQTIATLLGAIGGKQYGQDLMSNE